MAIEYLLFNLFIFVPILLISLIRPYKLRAIPFKSGAISITVSALFFIAFDMYATQLFWYFNPKYILGMYLYKIPLEEFLFFFSVPFACLFIWENIRNQKKTAPDFTALLILLFSAIGMYGLNHRIWYTVSVSGMMIACIALDKILRTGLFRNKRFYIFLIVVNVLTLIFNLYLTARPIVLYDFQFKTNLSVITIPVEDFIFGTALLTLNTLLYEKLR